MLGPSSGTPGWETGSAEQDSLTIGANGESIRGETVVLRDPTSLSLGVATGVTQLRETVAGGGSMWSSAPSPLLSGTKNRAAASPSKSGDLATGLGVGPGPSSLSTRAQSTATAKGGNERTTPPSNIYYVVCIATGLLLMLLILINNPLKIPEFGLRLKHHVVWKAVKPSPRRLLLQTETGVLAQPSSAGPPARPGLLPWLWHRHAHVADGEQSDGVIGHHIPTGSNPLRPHMPRHPIAIRALPPNAVNQTLREVFQTHMAGSSNTSFPLQLSAIGPGRNMSGTSLHRLPPRLAYINMIRAYQERQQQMRLIQAEIYGNSSRTANVVFVSHELPPQDLNAETYGCWGSGYMQNGCPRSFMDGIVRPTGANDSGPYVAYMQPARSLQQQTHAPTIIVLPNGELIAAWFDGVEGQAGVGIVVSRLPVVATGNREWTKPIMVSLDPARSAQNPVLWYDEAARSVFLMHTSQRAMQGQGTSDVRWLKSKDLGLSWTEPIIIFRRRGAFVRNNLVIGAKGEWLLPMYHTPGGYDLFYTHYCTMKRSSDKGRTWTDETRMSHPGQFLAQPTTVRLSRDPPVLMTWMRDRRNQFVYASKSLDDGWTWSAPKRTRLPNNNSGIQALRLLSGAIAMVFNNHGGGLDRWPITVALSYDGGETWSHVRDLDREPLALAYPALTQTPDGLIHIMYSYHRETIKYVAVTEEWIKAGSSRGIFKGDKERRATP